MNNFSLVEDLRLIRKEWYRNYRYHGGVIPLFKCIWGTGKLLSGFERSSQFSQQRIVECITFSVVPRLTALWVDFIYNAFNNQRIEVFIGDCSGGYRVSEENQSTHVIPMLNYHHGKKLDLFIREVTRAKYVIISDDDVFWLSDIPWKWALDVFERDKQVAVVSLIPRERATNVFNGKVQIPMGSYCLIINRDIWMYEELSFEIVETSKEDGYEYFFDTADYANLQLVKRGYKIPIAPADVRQHLLMFSGISAWAMRIQEKNGDISDVIREIPVRQKKALYTIFVLRGLGDIFNGQYSQGENSSFIPNELLDIAQNICMEFIDLDLVDKIDVEVKVKLNQIQRYDSLSKT